MCNWRFAVWESCEGFEVRENYLKVRQRKKTGLFVRLQDIGAEGVRQQVARDEIGEGSRGQTFRSHRIS